MCQEVTPPLPWTWTDWSLWMGHQSADQASPLRSSPRLGHPKTLDLLGMSSAMSPGLQVSAASFQSHPHLSTTAQEQSSGDLGISLGGGGGNGKSHETPALGHYTLMTTLQGELSPGLP